MVFEHDYKNFPELSNTQIAEFGFTSPHKQITEDFRAKVVKVHDGDTVTLQTDFRDFDFPLRFLGIDALELSEGGEEAREYLKGQIEGEEVEIKIDKNNRVGKYGRLLGNVFSLGMDMGETMLRMGYALEFGKKDENKPPNLDKMLKVKKWLT